ncbi:MAG TPA: TraB/GumN family protein [Verrucomicrobiae bacterium]|nr:TraB/GumN family protein [Verrucomicrobiae bacterium]
MNNPRPRILALFALLLALLQPVAAQQRSATATRQPLWKIEGKAATVYLLGSVHLLKKENYPLAAPIEAAFDRAKVVVFETDIEAFEKPEFQMKLLSKSALPEGDTLRNHLSPKLYEQLATQSKESGLPSGAIEKLKAGLAALTIEHLEMQKLGLDEKLGVDYHFFQRARKAGKEMIGLDTPDFHLELLTGLSKEEGEAILRSTLEDIRTLKQDLPQLLKSWQTGDMKTLANLLNEEMEKDPALYKRLVVDRNKRWVPKIEELVRGDKDAIIIVGVGHLAGKQSVIELLEKNGLKVTQQ